MPDPNVYQCGVDAVDVTRQVLAACMQDSALVPAAAPGREIGPGYRTAPGDRPRTVRLQCPNGHWCDYPCNPDTGTPSPIRGTPVSTDELSRWNKLLDYTDPQQGLERTEKYARWVLGATGVVTPLLAGLVASNTFEIDGRYERLAYGAAILLLGVSWAAASYSLAPQWARVNRSSPDSTIKGFNTLLGRRRGALFAAAVFFGLALLAAGMVPLADAIPDPANPRASVTYSIHHPGDSITAAVVGTGLAAQSAVEISVRAGRDPAGPSVRERAAVDTAGKGEARVVVDFDTASTVFVTGRWAEGASSGWAWREDTVTVDLRRLSATRPRPAASTAGDSATLSP